MSDAEKEVYSEEARKAKIKFEKVRDRVYWMSTYNGDSFRSSLKPLDSLHSSLAGGQGVEGGGEEGRLDTGRHPRQGREEEGEIMPLRLASLVKGHRLRRHF